MPEPEIVEIATVTFDVQGDLLSDEELKDAVRFNHTIGTELREDGTVGLDDRTGRILKFYDSPDSPDISLMFRFVLAHAGVDEPRVQIKHKRGRKGYGSVNVYRDNFAYFCVNALLRAMTHHGLKASKRAACREVARHMPSLGQPSNPNNQHVAVWQICKKMSGG